MEDRALLETPTPRPVSDVAALESSSPQNRLQRPAHDANLLTVTNNSSGGQLVSLANIEVRDCSGIGRGSPRASLADQESASFSRSGVRGDDRPPGYTVENLNTAVRLPQANLGLATRQVSATVAAAMRRR